MMWYARTHLWVLRASSRHGITQVMSWGVSYRGRVPLELEAAVELGVELKSSPW